MKVRVSLLVLLLAALFSSPLLAPAETVPLSSFLDKLFMDNGLKKGWDGFIKYFHDGFHDKEVAVPCEFVRSLADDPASALPAAAGMADSLIGAKETHELLDILDAAAAVWNLGEPRGLPSPPLPDDPLKMINSIYEAVELAGADAVAAVADALFKNDRFTTYNKLGTTIYRLMDNVFLNQPPSSKLCKSLSKTKAQIWIDVLTVLRNSPKIDRKILWEAMRSLAYLSEPANLTRIEKVLASAKWEKPEKLDGVEGSVLFFRKYSAGRVIIGGRGKTVYKKPAALIIDLGGNDVYEFAASSQDNVPASVVIDFHGADKYVYKRFEGRTVGGMLGLSLLIDREGADLYSAPRMGMAAAFYGISVLIDEKGNDRYMGGDFCCGAAMYGMGILVDREGDDLYQTGMLSLGFGGPMGIGILLDRKGKDRYKSVGVGKNPKDLDTFSQGVGFGFHPLTPDGGKGSIAAYGGVGLLVDAGGNDSYQSGAYSQGVSFHFGFGSLVDTEGNDLYTAGSYSQGAGWCGGFGILLDRKGNDKYLSNGRYSQGSAYDAAFALLMDEAGRDSYNGVACCQACCAHNGIALLFDLDGPDAYKTSEFGQGEVAAEGEHWEENWPSIAVLADFGPARNAFNGLLREDKKPSRADFAFFLPLSLTFSEAMKTSLETPER